VTQALLDVNVLLALVDPDHIDYEWAHDWASDGLGRGWATCAVTQNGLVRILSQPQYPNPLTVAAALDVLGAATRHPRHTFWPCDVQLADGHLRPDRLLGSRQVTDAYLLALAVTHRGTLVTLDRRIDPATVKGAADDHLVVI